ncbi:MAG: DUF4920 domain-containing protein [Gracilimonas sp.]|nr:DUF4920 domain-containing protein [Gracilimonas sp.]
MKNLILFTVLLLPISLFAQETETVRLSEPVQVTENYEVFGSEVDEWESPISLKELIESENDISDKQVTIETEIAEVCQKKGCFFVANDEGYSARITFKDYSFFIPTDSKGKTVMLKGTFKIKELSQDQAKHYAEDAGQDPDEIEGPQKEYSFVATSVKIPKS